uniref:Uncharacterized protein n=1 Tax=Meloidogyne incognita TaxID=6306 RepID=A0A914M9M0_MELIC
MPEVAPELRTAKRSPAIPRKNAMLSHKEPRFQLLYFLQQPKSSIKTTEFPNRCIHATIIDKMKSNQSVLN